MSRLTPRFTRADTRMLDKRIAHDGHYRLVDYRLCHRRYDGSWSAELSREVLETQDSSAVLLFDPRRRRVFLVEQFRSGHFARGPDTPWSLECVAGRIAPPADAAATAIREAHEEAGLNVERLIPIGAWATTPGQSSEVVHVFLGLVDSDLIEGSGGIAGEHEDIRIISVGLDDALASLGKMGSLVTATALIWLDGRLARGEFQGEDQK